MKPFAAFDFDLPHGWGLFRPVLGALTLAALLPSSAMASSNFPGRVSSHLGDATPVPACTVCHESNAGGFGTVTRAHGIAMMDAGLQAGNQLSLDSALDDLASNDVDSDGGGVGDIDELLAGTDPNVADDDGQQGGGGGGGGGTGPVQFGFGCGASEAPAGAAAFGLLGALAAWRRRRWT